MATLREWISIRKLERLGAMLQAWASLRGTLLVDPKQLDERDPTSFLLMRIAELQARCDALEARVDALQSSKVMH